jgi:hypothetical protein
MSNSKRRGEKKFFVQDTEQVLNEPNWSGMKRSSKVQTH